MISWRKKAIFLTILAFVVSPVFSQNEPNESESAPLIITRNPHGHHNEGSARLIIHRLPNLGSNVIVDLWIDGVVASPIGYGHTFEARISPGPHVLTLLATPSGTWKIPANIPVTIRAGETYSFTVKSDHSGQLNLSGGPIAR